jgi:hypothetical protein
VERMHSVGQQAALLALDRYTGAMAPPKTSNQDGLDQLI